MGFLDHELGLAGNTYGKLGQHCTIIDTLVMARKIRPGQKNNLDALCKHYDVNNTQRELHGALLDAEILSEVYLRMTGGQVGLMLDAEQERKATGKAPEKKRISKERSALSVVRASATERAAHDDILKNMGESCLWQSAD